MREVKSFLSNLARAILYWCFCTILLYAVGIFCSSELLYPELKLHNSFVAIPLAVRAVALAWIATAIILVLRYSCLEHIGRLRFRVHPSRAIKNKAIDVTVMRRIYWPTTILCFFCCIIGGFGISIAAPKWGSDSPFLTYLGTFGLDIILAAVLGLFIACLIIIAARPDIEDYLNLCEKAKPEDILTETDYDDYDIEE